jgi:hypothetical protein
MWDAGQAASQAHSPNGGVVPNILLRKPRRSYIFSTGGLDKQPGFMLEDSRHTHRGELIHEFKKPWAG